MATPKRPPKRGAVIPQDRPLGRLQPADRDRVREQVAAFLAYAAMRKARSVKQPV